MRNLGDVDVVVRRLGDAVVSILGESVVVWFLEDVTGLNMNASSILIVIADGLGLCPKRIEDVVVEVDVAPGERGTARGGVVVFTFISMFVAGLAETGERGAVGVVWTGLVGKGTVSV